MFSGIEPSLIKFEFKYCTHSLDMLQEVVCQTIIVKLQVVKGFGAENIWGKSD